jgi:hypothetical protein
VAVTVVNRGAARIVRLTYEIFDARSTRRQEGTLAENAPAPARGTADHVLPLRDLAPGDYTVKLTAVTTRGERAVELLAVTVGGR